MFCQQNANLLMLNGHPDITAVSKFSKRTNFEGFQIGDLVDCKVSSMDRFGNVSFDLVVGESGKSALVTAFAKKNKLQEGINYKPGTVHQARILSFKMVERALVVTTRKEILTQKMVSVK
ncbi:unnamed protein product, partial [Gongylonema pulchrum]|uniref:S1 motif domain-containing protein n=1 Tax=Gongylonema pulchrum TaxID=637853 RepID=A0A183EUR0_9BILA